MQTLFTTALASLTDIEQSTKRKMLRFRKATKWAEQCESIQSNINDAQNKILHINSFLGHTSVVTSTAQTAVKDMKQNIETVKDTVKDTLEVTMKESEKKLIQAIEKHDASSSIDKPTDNFKPCFLKLPVSIAATPNFESPDPHGNPSTTEARLTNRLLSSSQSHETKIFAIYGPGGVGKTTCMHMLSHEHQIRQHFIHGIYYLKLGADAKTESAVCELVKMIRDSGGIALAHEAGTMKSIEDVISIASEWFRDKRYLVLVDDVWERGQIGSLLVLLLRRMMCGSEEGAIVFTTRDATLATDAVFAFPLESRYPLGVESRTIMFRHARQNPGSVYEESTEKAIETLLQSCGGLPVAHSVVGKGVLQVSMRRNVGQEDAWRICAQSQKNILQRRAEDYDCLYSVFKTAVRVLEEERLQNRYSTQDANGYCYGEIHRSLCVLEKQQWAPIHMLQRMWDVECENETRRICENLVRVGLAEWQHEEIADDQGNNTYVEGISIHDLIHDFATEETKREDDVETWHRKVVEGYTNQKKITTSPGIGCRQLWKVGEDEDCKDGGYFNKNICRHLYRGGSDANETVMLVTRPEWIKLQLCKNGVLQYESDIGYGMKSIQNGRETGGMGMRELEMIQDAARLSASYIWKNSKETWFQLYGRLIKWGKVSESMKAYLKYLENNADRPWLRSIENSDGLLTSAGSAARALVDVRKKVLLMAVLPGGGEVVCGCENGEIVIVSLKENVMKLCWVAHEKWINALELSEKENFIVSVSNDGLGKIWETGSWHLVKKLAGHVGRIQGVGISKDETRVFTCCRDDESIRIWNVESGECIHVLRTDSVHARTMLVVRNGMNIISRSRWDGNKLIMMQIKDESAAKQECKDNCLNEQYRTKEINVHSKVRCMAVSKDESKIITGHADASFQLWDANNMTPINHPWTTQDTTVNCVSFNRDGTRIALGCDDETIEVRDVNTGQLVCPSFTRHTGTVSRVEFIEEYSNVVSCSEDKTVRVWKIDECTSKETEEQIDEDVTCVTCSADESCFVTGHWNGRLSVRDAATGQLIRKSERIHNGSIMDVAVTTDGRWILSIGDDRMVRVSRWERLEEVDTFETLTSSVRGAEISVTTLCDKSIRIWDFIKCHKGTESDDWTNINDECLISDDDERFISQVEKDYELMVELWDIETSQCVRIKPLEPYQSLREETMNTAEPQAEVLNFPNMVFVPQNTNEIRYGDASNSVVLGTTE